MKKRLYAIGLLSLPLFYIGLMLATAQPIDWGVLGLMALICSPLLLWKTIGKVEKEFNALSDKEKMKKIGEVAKTTIRRGPGAGS